MKDSIVISLTREEAQTAWENSPRAKAKRLVVGDLLINRSSRETPPVLRIVQVVGASLYSEAGGGGWLRVKTVWHEHGSSSRTTRPSFATIDNGDFRVYTAKPTPTPKQIDLPDPSCVIAESGESAPIPDYRRDLLFEGMFRFFVGDVCDTTDQPIVAVADSFWSHLGETLVASRETNRLLTLVLQNQSTAIAELRAIRQAWEGSGQNG